MKRLTPSKKVEIALILGFTIAVLASSLTGFAQSVQGIRDSMLRLHVLANSDSDEDQLIKMEVRDQVLAYGGDCFYDTDFRFTKQEAKDTISSRLGEIKQIAEQVITSHGKDYGVEVSVENTYFDTRQYEEVTLPAGNYDALVIRLGEAEGKNWWCVMFPPMCLPAASESQELAEVLDDGQLRIVTDDTTYNIKFAVVELWEDITGS